MKSRRNIIKHLYYNFISKNIQRYEKGSVVPFYGSYFICAKGSKLVLFDKLYTNSFCIKKTNNSTVIRLDEDAHMLVKGKWSIYYGGDIICFKGARLQIGSGFCNCNVKIRCTNSITIGENVKISHDVTIMDSDAHFIEYSGYQPTKPVEIGNNVWVGSRVTILKGVKIGDGSIIGAGSVVTRSIPERCIAVGNPAVVIKENIVWRG